MQTTTSREKIGINHELDTKVNRHFLACSVLAGAAALVGTQHADAQIIWSGIQNAPIPSTNGFGGVYIDIDGMGWHVPAAGAGTGALSLPGYEWNPYRGNLSTFANALRSEWAPGSAQNPQGAVSGGFIARLDAGTMIDASLTYDGNNTRAMAQTGGPWVNADGYVGVRFLINDAPVYGWLHLVTGGGDAPTGGPGFPAVITDWAYDASGAGIVAGVVPEPSTVALGCLGAGALGLAAWRKRKKKS